MAVRTKKVYDRNKKLTAALTRGAATAGFSYSKQINSGSQFIASTYQVIAAGTGSRTYNLFGKLHTVPLHMADSPSMISVTGFIEGADSNGHCKLRINGTKDFDIAYS